MKTSEALLELAYKASKSGAMSADQALAMLRRVEWGVGHDVEVDHASIGSHPDEPETEQERADLDWFRNAPTPAARAGYVTDEYGRRTFDHETDEPAERDGYPLKPE